MYLLWVQITYKVGPRAWKVGPGALEDSLCGTVGRADLMRLRATRQRGLQRPAGFATDARRRYAPRLIRMAPTRACPG